MKRPNIIILNPDQMRHDALGHSGNPVGCTPNLDRFLEESVSFSNAYCQNPVCVPSRCSFLTGLYPHTRGHRTMSYLLRPGETTLFSILRDAGYYVWMNSRNDLVAAQDDEWLNSHASEIFYDFNDGREEKKSSQHMDPAFGEFPYSHLEGVTELAKDDDWKDTEAAVERILHPVDKDKPLCMFIGWFNPHVPYTVERRFYERIDKTKLPRRVRYEETSGKSMMLNMIHENVGLDDFPEEDWDELRAIYYAQCLKVDEMFQRICDALKEAGEYDNSAIFFFSDHGDYTGDYGVPEKSQNSFEDDIVKVPFLVKPPKGYDIDPGISDSLVELVDFYATALHYAGVESDHDHFGKDLSDVLADRSKEVRSFVCTEGGRLPHEYQCNEWDSFGKNGPSPKIVYYPKMVAQHDNSAHEKGTMIFDGHYKYVHRLFGDHELYDMEKDPHECINIYEENRDSDIVKKLQLSLLDWYQRTADIVPRDYDSRFAKERLWLMAKRFKPNAEQEKMIREYIDKENPSIMEVRQYASKLTKGE